MNGRLSDRLRRFYDPRTLRAPLGRNPDGWPLLGCGTCGQAIPWRVNRNGQSGCLESPRVYYARRFCDQTCKAAWDGNEARMTALRAIVPTFLDPWSVPLPTVPTFARPLPTFAEIRSCSHCHAPGPFEIVEVGKVCFACGHLNFAKDGAWESERLTVR